MLCVGLEYRIRGFVYCDRCVFLCAFMGYCILGFCVLLLRCAVVRRYGLPYIGVLCIVNVMCCCASLYGSVYGSLFIVTVECFCAYV